MHQSMSDFNRGNTTPTTRGNTLSFALRRRSSHRKFNEETSSTVERFHNSLQCMDFKLGDDEASEQQPKSEPFVLSPSNPSQNRRSMLVRHSSVSALQTGDRSFQLEIKSPTTPRGTTRSVFQRSSTHESVLPGTIQIRPRLGGRSTSSRTLGRARTLQAREFLSQVSHGLGHRV